jgi:hypothetical protein
MHPLKRRYELLRYRLGMKRAGQISYSQIGEDLIAGRALNRLKIAPEAVRYLDLGSYHPVKLSNTYGFYRKGGSGTCVDANPLHCSAFPLVRPRDRCLNHAIAAQGGGTLRTFILSVDSLSTCDEAEAQRMVRDFGHRIVRTLDVPMIGINDLLADTAAAGGLSFVSMDLEGSDEAILAAWDFTRWRPAVLCVETSVHSAGGPSVQRNAISTTMLAAGYRSYAHTGINTIFIDSSR